MQLKPFMLKVFLPIQLNEKLHISLDHILATDSFDLSQEITKTEKECIYALLISKQLNKHL